MIKIYRKTATIKAEQFDGSDEMIDKYELIDAGTMLGTHHSPELYLTGSGKLNVCDWIATGANGEHWSIADDVLKKTYAELPVIPKAVGEILRSAHGQDNLLGVLETAKNGHKVSETLAWIITNQNTFARAWLDGYQVED